MTILQILSPLHFLFRTVFLLHQDQEEIIGKNKTVIFQFEYVSGFLTFFNLSTNCTNHIFFTIVPFHSILWIVLNNMDGVVINYRFNRFDQNLCWACSRGQCFCRNHDVLLFPVYTPILHQHMAWVNFFNVSACLPWTIYQTSVLVLWICLSVLLPSLRNSSEQESHRANGNPRFYARSCV